MKNKFFLLCQCIALITACARPNYEQKNAPNEAQTLQSNALLDCSIQFNTSGNCLWWSWKTYPTETESGVLIFKIYQLKDFPSFPTEVDAPSVPEFVPWMTSMSHGSTPTTVSRIDIGTYEVKDVFFIMPGEWDLKFQIKQGDIVQDEAIVSILF